MGKNRQRDVLYNMIRIFQKENGIVADGYPGRNTLSCLGYNEEEIEALMEFYSSYSRWYVGVQYSMLKGARTQYIKELREKYMKLWRL